MSLHIPYEFFYKHVDTAPIQMIIFKNTPRHNIRYKGELIPYNGWLDEVGNEIGEARRFFNNGKLKFNQ